MTETESDIFTHGSIVYSAASTRLLQALDPVQNVALRLALRAFPITPIQSLHAVTGVLPLIYRRKTFETNFHIHAIS